MSKRGQLVGKEGVEPSRPFGHTDLNRARLPFRHFPGSTIAKPLLSERAVHDSWHSLRYAVGPPPIGLAVRAGEH